MTITAERYHDISAGHRVYGQKNEKGEPGACSKIHGHNYRITFYCEAPALDDIGMVVDFGVIKSTLCKWLDDNWDHRCLVWKKDPIAHPLRMIEPSTVTLGFNPTAENLGCYLLETVGPKLLKETKVVLVKVRVEETRKCSATVSL